MSHHRKFTDEANVSQEQDSELSHEDECKFFDDILDLEETIQDSRSTIPTNNSTAPLSPFQSSKVSDSQSGSSASREWQGNSRMEPLPGPSYLTSRIVIESQNHSHLPTREHGYQNPLMVSRNRSESIPIAETCRYSFTSQEDQPHSHVEPVEGETYGRVSGKTLTQECDNSITGQNYVQYGIGKACAGVQNSVPESVSMKPENFESEKIFYGKELEIPDSIRKRLTDDDSTMQNAGDTSRILHIQESHLGDRKKADLNVESKDYSTASYVSTDASKLTYHDGNSHEKYLHAFRKTLTSRDSGIPSEIDLSISSTVPMKVTSDSCVTSISKISDNVTRINPTPTVSLKEINCSKVHDVSEVNQNSVSDVRKPNDAITQQINNDCRSLPYQVTSNESGSFLAVPKNVSGGSSAPGLNNTNIITENKNLMQPKSVEGKENAFICQICRKIFNQKDELRSHEITHTREIPFKCCVCGKTFCKMYLLRRHRRVHTGERPFKCDVCNKSFSQSGNLTRHKGIHDK